MDPLGNNKIFAAILGSALVFMAIRTIPEYIMHHDYPDVPAYSVGPLEVADEGGEEDLPFPQASWVAAMDAERGAKVFKKCTSCHNVEKGGAHSTGPNLYNVVGEKSGEKAGFAYSEAMANAGYAWGYEELDGFLEKPSKYLPGTKMNFVGLKKAEDRAAVVEYLRVAADTPVPQPEPAAVPLTEVAEDATDVPNEIAITEPSIDSSEDDGDNVAEEAVPTEGQPPVNDEVD